MGIEVKELFPERRSLLKLPGVTFGMRNKVLLYRREETDQTIIVSYEAITWDLWSSLSEACPENAEKVLDELLRGRVGSEKVKVDLHHVGNSGSVFRFRGSSGTLLVTTDLDVVQL